MLSANRLSRHSLSWLRFFLSATLILAAGFGCHRWLLPATAEPPVSALSRTARHVPARRDHQPKEDRPAGIVFSPCDRMCEAATTTPSVTGTVFLNLTGADNPTVTIQIYQILTNASGKTTLTKVTTGGPIGVTKSGRRYTFTIDQSTQNLKAGQYVVVATADTAAGKQYVAATLYVDDCPSSPHLRGGTVGPSQERLAAQDIPASATPLPSNIFGVGDMNAQICVSLEGGAAQDDTVKVTYFDAASGMALKGTDSVTIKAGFSAATVTITPVVGPGGVLGSAGDELAVATLGGSSTSCSFTVQ